MIFPAHLVGGYLAIKIANKINPNLGLLNNGLIITGLVGSVLPDVDLFFFKNLKDHHNSWFHAPLFWVSVYATITIFSLITKNQTIMSYSTALIIGVLVHIFLDWFSARTTGIKFLYPFSEKMFSLYPLSPQKGEIQILPLSAREWQLNP